MADRPNILLVLADDLGYGDLACFGAKDVQTPNLDKFASEGLRFTACYAGHANCSPSRTALMTGRTPTRVGVRDWIPRTRRCMCAAVRSPSPNCCSSPATRPATAGKWHMNGEFNQPTQPQPNDHGFDHWFSTQNNAYPNHHNPDNFVRNGKALGKTRRLCRASRGR
jgi:arylsulfatase A